MMRYPEVPVKLLAALLLSLFALPSLATDLTIRCTPPIKNADGSALATGATITTNVYGGTSPTTLKLLTPTPLAACLSVRSNVNAGQACYAVTAVETIAGISAESTQTAPICVTVPPVPPPVGGVTVSLATTSTIAYMMPTGENTFAPLIVGSAPLATSCDATHSVQAAGVAYYVIPWTAVTFSGALKPHTVYANCS
jgi:hypothetical protein